MTTLGVGARELEAALERAQPEQPLDVLHLRLGGPAHVEGRAAAAHDLPGPWESARLRELDLPGAQRGALLHRPDDSSHEPTGWRRAFPVWWARARGARVLVLELAGTPTPEFQSPTGWAHAQSLIDLTADSPLIGLGPSPRGPLFPDRTQVLAPDLAPVAERLLGSVPVAAVGTRHASAPWTAPDQEAIAGAEVVVPGLADFHSACAHTALPLLALVRCSSQATTDALDLPLFLERLLQLAPPNP